MNWIDAHAQGLTIYPSNRPCPRGHGALRYVSNNGCITCLRARQHRSARYVAGVPLVRLVLMVHPDDAGALTAANEALLAGHK